MSSKVVEIRRVEIKTRIPKNVYSESKQTIGSVYKGSVPLSGLSREEEEALLPSILGIAPNEPTWRKEVLDFWKNLRISVPVESEPHFKLEIGKDKDGRLLVELDYIKYRFCEAHPEVANSKTEVIVGRHRYYIDDPTVERDVKHKKLSAKKRAYGEFIKVTADEDFMDTILRVFSGKLVRVKKTGHIINPELLDIQDKELQLEKLYELDPTLFLETVNDKNLQDMSLIEKGISENAIEVIGSTYQMDGFGIMGTSVDEAVTFIQNPSNSKAVATLKARVGLSRGDKEAAKKRDNKKTKEKETENAGNANASRAGAGASKD